MAVATSLWNVGDSQRERLSDNAARMKAVKGNKSRVAANPGVAERPLHNPAITSNL